MSGHGSTYFLKPPRYVERAQTDYGVARVREWAVKEGDLGPEVTSCRNHSWTPDQDLLISGDVDEIMSREALHQLKWCEVGADVFTGEKRVEDYLNQNLADLVAFRSPVDAPG